MITGESVFAEYQRAKGRWSKPPYIPKKIKDFTSIRKRADWHVFLEIAEKIDRSNGIILKYFINGMFFANKDKNKKIYPRKFLSKEAVENYIAYVDYLNTISNGSQVGHIKNSCVMIKTYMDEHNLKTFEEYLSENLNLYPTFVTHLQNGFLNYFLFTAYRRSSEFINKIAPDVIEDITHYLDCRQDIKLKIITIREFTEATDSALKELKA